MTGRTRADLIVPAAVSLVIVAAGLLFRVPCVRHNGDTLYSEKHLCYTDVFALYGDEGLDRGTVPYFHPKPDGRYMEYPVVTGFWMYGLAKIAGPDDPARNFWIQEAALALLVLVASVILGELVGWRRALLFAAAPTLALHFAVNWDVLAVAPFCAAMLLYTRGRDGPAGALIGFGAAAKLYPLLVVPALVVQRLREGRRDGAFSLAMWTAGVTMAINLPVMLGASRGWSEFFRLNAERGADLDSVWHHVMRTFGYEVRGTLLNAGTGVAILAGIALLAWWQWRRSARDEHDAIPGLRRSTIIASWCAVAWFLMVNKVWSPQYSLWLLPFWALAFRRVSRWVLAAWVTFQALEIGVWIVSFWSPARANLVSYPWFRAVIVSRLAAMLLLIAVLLASRSEEARPIAA